VVIIILPGVHIILILCINDIGQDQIYEVARWPSD